MAKPSRNTKPEDIQEDHRSFFISSHAVGHPLQTERMANLMIDVLRNYVTARKFVLNDFVVMPDPLHLIITLDRALTVERAVQLVKGNFSYRAKKELGFQREIWQPGFSDERICDRESFLAHRKYIDENPVKAGLAKTAEEYPYCSAYFRKKNRG